MFSARSLPPLWRERWLNYDAAFARRPTPAQWDIHVRALLRAAVSDATLTPAEKRVRAMFRRWTASDRIAAAMLTRFFPVS